MKLHLAGSDGANAIRGCDASGIRVNEATYPHAVVVLPDEVISPWAPSGFADLSAADFDAIGATAPELVLLGTGTTLRFPHPSLTKSLTERGIGVEVMDTQAACRTYNVIMAEGRRVAAALLPTDD